MTKYILTFLLLTTFITAQELHIRGTVKIDSLITTYIFADSAMLFKSDSTLFATQSDIAPLASKTELGDSVDLRIPKDFSDFDTPNSLREEVLYLPLNIDGDATAYKVSAISLPPSETTIALLEGRVSIQKSNGASVSYPELGVLPSYENFYKAYLDTVAYLIALIGSKDTSTVPDSPAVPVFVSAIAGTGSTASIVLTWTQAGSYDSVAIFLSTDGGESFSTTALAWVDSGTTTYTHTNQPAGQDNWYYLKAINSGIYSGNSNLKNATVTDIISTGYYVSNVGAGDESGSSWTNAKAFEDITDTWLNQLSVNDGARDTLFFDGGTDSLVYNTKTSQASYAGLRIMQDGTASNKLVFTRGKEAGHNGIPVFEFADGVYGFWVVGANYVEISYLKFRANDTYAVYINQDNHYVDFTYNHIDYTLGSGLGIGSNIYTDNIRVLHNYIYTNTVSGALGSIYQLQNNDAIHAIWSGDLEIGYNTIIQRVSIPSGGSHRDIMQLSQCNWNSGEVISIHDNFINVFFTTASELHNTNFIKANDTEGTYRIYNNILSWENSAADITFDTNLYGTSDWSGDVRTTVLPLHYEVYNNTFIMNANNSYIGSGINWDVGYVSSVKFKNNLWKCQDDNLGYPEGTNPSVVLDFDYNVYQLSSNTIFSDDYTWAQWQASGQDLNSYNSTTALTFVDNDPTTFNADTAGYRLDASSTYGIDDGVDLGSLSYLQTDIAGNSRTIATSWDIGAFENELGGTPAENPELITNGTFTDGIASWAAYNSTIKHYSSDWNTIGRTNVLLDSATATSNVRPYQYFAEPLTGGVTYDWSFDYYIPSANTLCEKIQLYITNGTTTQIIIVDVLDTWTTASGSFTPADNKTDIYFRMMDSANNAANITAGDLIYLDNVSIKEQ